MSDTTTTTPTEEQVQAANAAQDAKWQDDFKEEDLAIPYKREESAEEGDKKTEEDSKTTEQTVTTPEVEEDVDEPEQVVTMEDPGDFTPADYSFEVTLKDGKTVKVNTPEEADKLAEDPDNFETPKQLMEFITKSNKMQRNLDRDHDEWESKKKTYDAQVEESEKRRETTEQYVSEFAYLVKKGVLPKIEEKYLTADWSDPEVAKQPGVKEQVELLNYMVTENKERKKAGVKPLESIVDTYNAWVQDTSVKKSQEQARAAGEARKTAGARVAGVSAAEQVPYVPKGIAVGNPNVFKRGAAVWD
jgi:hypothetical protein